MKLSRIFTVAYIATFLILSACAHTGGAKDSACHDSYSENHGTGDVQQFKAGDQPISSYQNFFFSQASPANLVDFINEHHIQMVVDLRQDASNKDLPDKYPAVYWSYSFDDISKIDHQNIQHLEEQLDAFADKSIIFISTSGDAAVTTFIEYWAAANSLNDKWIDRLATELGLKDRAWLSKWSEIENQAENVQYKADDNEQRSSASESVDSKTTPKK